MTLTFFVCAAVFLLLIELQSFEAEPGSRPSTVRVLAFWLCLAAGTMTKGPLAVILVALATLPFLLARRRLGFAWRMRPLLGDLVPLALPGAWYAHGLAVGAREFGFRTFLMENVLMFLGAEGGGGHRHGLFFFVPDYFFFGLPWSLLLPAAVVWASAAGEARGRASRWSCRWGGSPRCSCSSPSPAANARTTCCRSCRLRRYSWRVRPRRRPRAATRRLDGGWGLARGRSAWSASRRCSSSPPRRGRLRSCRPRSPRGRARSGSSTSSPAMSERRRRSSARPWSRRSPFPSRCVSPTTGMPLAAGALSVAAAIGATVFQRELVADDTYRPFAEEIVRVAGKDGTIRRYGEFETQRFVRVDELVAAASFSRRAIDASRDATTRFARARRASTVSRAARSCASLSCGISWRCRQSVSAARSSTLTCRRSFFS
jgi:hypothetical protein